MATCNITGGSVPQHEGGSVIYHNTYTVISGDDIHPPIDTPVLIGEDGLVPPSSLPVNDSGWTAYSVKIVSNLGAVVENVDVSLTSGDFTLEEVLIAGITDSPPGSQGDLYYRHVQSSASAIWTIVHNLGKYPSVSVVDSGGNFWLTKVTYVDLNTVTATFSAAFSGEAYCN